MRRATTEPAWVRAVLIGGAIAVSGPVRRDTADRRSSTRHHATGSRPIFPRLRNPTRAAAIRLTLFTAAIAVPLNTMFRHRRVLGDYQV